MNQKIRDRARKIAASAAGPSKEADNARRLLRRMCDRWPELVYYLDENATVMGEGEIDVPSPAHRAILWHLAKRFDLEVRFDAVPSPPDGVPMVRTYLVGMQGEVRQVLESYVPHADSLAVIMALLGELYVQRCLEPGPDPVTDESDDDVTDEVEELEGQPDIELPPSETAAWEANESDRNRMVMAMLNDVDRASLSALVRGLVEATAPVREPPRLLIDESSFAWNAPEIEIVAFVAIYRAFFPGGALEDTMLQTRFDEGMRIYPPTRRFRYVPDLDRMRDAFWTEDDYFETPK